MTARLQSEPKSLSAVFHNEKSDRTQLFAAFGRPSLCTLFFRDSIYVAMRGRGERCFDQSPLGAFKPSKGGGEMSK